MMHVPPHRLTTRTHVKADTSNTPGQFLNEEGPAELDNKFKYDRRKLHPDIVALSGSCVKKGNRASGR